MEKSFAGVVEQVQKLSREEKEELRRLLDKYLMEMRREELHNNFLETKNFEKEGKLFTPKDNDELRKWLEE